MPATTQAVVEQHLRAARQGVDALVQDFADDAVVITPQGSYCGRDEIRRFYKSFLEGMPEGFFEAFKLNRQEFVGDVGYLVWEAKPWLPLASDTFLVRDGRIRVQTFAAYAATP